MVAGVNLKGKALQRVSYVVTMCGYLHLFTFTYTKLVFANDTYVGLDGAQSTPKVIYALLIGLGRLFKIIVSNLILQRAAPRHAVLSEYEAVAADSILRAAQRRDVVVEQAVRVGRADLRLLEPRVDDDLGAQP